RTRLDQFGRGVGRATGLAVVAVLVGGAATRAGALDEAVGQEHALLGIVELCDRTPADVPRLVQAGVERLGELPVGWRVGRGIVVEGHAEVGEVTLVRGLDAGDV